MIPHTSNEIWTLVQVDLYQITYIVKMVFYI